MTEKACKGSTRACRLTPLFGLGVTAFWAMLHLLSQDLTCAYVALVAASMTAYDQATLRRHLRRPHLRDRDVA